MIAISIEWLKPKFNRNYFKSELAKNWHFKEFYVIRQFNKNIQFKINIKNLCEAPIDILIKTIKSYYWFNKIIEYDLNYSK